MGFQIVYGSPQTVWMPVYAGATVYTGGLLTFNTGTLTEHGIQHLAAASGHSNTSEKDVPFGICLGNNLRSKLYSATYQTEYITATAAGSSHGDTTEYFGVEGPWSKGEKLAMVEVALIDPCTVIRGPIRNAAVGTPPTLLTATAASTDGLGTTTNAVQFTPIDSCATFYCRTGANAGAYRQSNTTSTTVHTWTRALCNDVAIGDTFVAVPLRYGGVSYMDIASTSASWVEASANYASNDYVIHVIELDLREAGKETVTFRFDADNFGMKRA